jgi:hypothetical protein
MRVTLKAINEALNGLAPDVRLAKGDVKKLKKVNKTILSGKADERTTTEPKTGMPPRRRQH